MNELMHPEAIMRLSPESLEIATTYLQCSSITKTAEILNIESEEVTQFLNKKEVKRFLDTVYLDQGYLNRHKIQEAMSRIIELKLQEMEEAEIGSSKDIADLLQMAHKMRMDELKNMQDKGPEPKVVVNNGVGTFGDNYGDLINKLMGNQDG